MKGKNKSRIKEKFQILRNLKIKNFSLKNVDDIISLIKQEYGNNYPDKEFYNINVVKNYIKKMNDKNDKRDITWRGAFLNGELIGQVLAITEHRAAFLKLAMISKNYNNLGVMIRLGASLRSRIKKHKGSDFKCAYAFVNNKIIPMLKICNKFGFKKLGIVPYFDNDKYIIIYGRIVFDFKWKLITPHIQLCQNIFNAIKEAKLNRLLSANLIPIYIKEPIKNYIVWWEKHKGFPCKYSFYISNKKYAEFFENTHNKSWYAFKFLKNISIELKYTIIKRLVDLFNGNESINSLSIPVEVNNNELQAILLKLKMKYYAYLPFYNGKNDYILLGLSKIEKN